MSLHTINRMSEDKFGTGLPIYTHKEYQIRKPNSNGDSEPYGSKKGYWICPSNKLPTLQFLYTGATLTKVEVVEVCGSEDGDALEINTSNIETQDINTGTVFYTTDIDRKFSLCAGLYYILFTLSDGTLYYSEVFEVGVLCTLYSSLSFAVQSVEPDLSANVNFTLQANNSNDEVSIVLTVNGVEYFGTGTFLINVTTGGSTVFVNVLSEQCGAYEQAYSFINNAGVSFSLNKLYNV
jgi:hypothetical protein